MPKMSHTPRRSIVNWTELLLGFAVCVNIIIPARCDEFSRLAGPPLFDLPKRSDAHSHSRLSSRALESLNEVLRGERAAFVIAVTDQGNFSKLLLSSGMRRRGVETGKTNLVAVTIVDRYETIDSGNRTSLKARGRDLILFDGFQLDLDSGQVVPEGFGGDIRFSIGGAGGPEIQALGTCQLFTFEKPLPSSMSSPGKPSSGRTVIPTDFNGRYSLVANGQLSGSLELSVDREQQVSGRFRSDRNGAIYDVTGKVASDLPRKIEFTVHFPRSKQDYSGLLWTEEKNVFAGMVQILDHPYSFFAIREGATLPSDSFDVSPTTLVEGSAPAVVVIEEGIDRFSLEGKVMAAAQLEVSLAQIAKMRPAIVAQVLVPDSAPFDQVFRVLQLIRKAGIGSIRLAPRLK